MSFQSVDHMRRIVIALIVLLTCLFAPLAEAARPPEEVLRTWYKLVLELVRHTPTYSPPVASRSFAYLGVTAYEAVASSHPTLRSLAGQLNGLETLPKPAAEQSYDESLVLHSALAAIVQNVFGNTGPTGQRALVRLEAKLRDELVADLAPDVVQRSSDHGTAIAAHVLAWSQSDGGATITNLGFPMTYEMAKGPGNWQPTSKISLQQFPLLPNWGKNRTFAMPSGAACPLPAHPEYSEDPASAFYKEAVEVKDVRVNLTPEQRTIARFWSDDPMLSPTPPGHWISIALTILDRDKVSLEKSAETLARLGIAMSDAFVGCWAAKFDYDLLRPVTYIKRTMDKTWEPLLITPPFPEYPSGHSTQSGAAATVLTHLFGDNFAFVDDTHKRDGLKPRPFSSFWAAADEAGISRLYGGIHFRAGVERGLDQGRCIGAYAVALKTGQ